MESLPLEHERRAGRIPRAVHASILSGVLALNLDGFGRSLWLDEAWVANSIRQDSLSEMFHYTEWLQTTPPFFLLAARGVAGVFGFSTTALRTVPLLFALLAALGMLALARRVVSPPVALAATALLMFHPVPVEYFRAFKQYGAETFATVALLLAATVYLKQPDQRAFGWLVAAAVALMPFSYPLVFLIPGIALAVGGRRGIVLGLIASVELAALYFAFLRPNVAPELWSFFRPGPDSPIGGGATVIGIGAAVAAYAAWRIVRRGLHWPLVIVLLPCALLLAAEASGWYPSNPRTRLFLRPCYLLALAIAADDLYRRIASRWRYAQVGAVLAAFGVMGWGLYKHFAEGRGGPHEDFIAAVQFLYQHSVPEDTLYVHASTREAFRLYTDLAGWHPQVVYGESGWPCCPRAKAQVPVRQDVDAKVPSDFTGRLWLLYTSRGEHWKRVGADEGELWRSLLQDRGCRPAAAAHPVNLVIQEMICTPP